MSSMKTLSFRPLNEAKGGGTCLCGDGHLRPSGQAQRGQVFAGSPTEPNFAARESFYYKRGRETGGGR